LAKIEHPLRLSSDEALQLARWDAPRLRDLLANMHATELAELLIGCRKDDARFSLIPYIADDVLGDALLELPEAMQEDLLAVLKPSEIEEVVEHLNSDDATDLLQAMDKEPADEVMGDWSQKSGAV